MANPALTEDAVNTGAVAWVLTSAALVFLMTAGLGFFYGGLVRDTNVINTMMMSVASMAIVCLTWVVFGFSWAFGDNGSTGFGMFVGNFDYSLWTNLDMKMWGDSGLPGLCFAAFQMTFAIIASAIISGSLVERMRFSAYSIMLALWSLLIYAPLCHWVWGPGGWIAEFGALDFAGGTVVHISSGVSGLVAGAIVGPRRHVEKELGPANAPFVILGGSLLWFGWLGFNGGSALSVSDGVAARAVATTFVAAASSMLTWLMLERLLKGKASSVGASVGAVAGLVCITPGAGFVTPGWSIAIGALGAVWCYVSVEVVNRVNLVDDTLDAFGLHGMGGIGGAILTGIFALDGGLIYTGSFELLGKQIVGALAGVAFSAIGTAIIVVALRLVMKLRIPEEQEVEGVDQHTHGETYHSPVKKYPQMKDWSYPFPREVIKKSEMEITGDGVSCKVRVQRAEVAIAELEEAIFVVTLVPEGAKGAEWCSRTERAQRAAKGVEGWIFTCGSDRLHDFLTKISYAGGIRSGLTNHYHMFAQGKQGLGAFSFVACAAEMKTDRIVAIKNLKLQVNPITIFKEVDMLRHPNIVRFHGLWADSTPSEQSKGGKQWYMVMDYFKCDLYDRIVEGRRLREKDCSECIPILHNVLAAIAFLHQRQIFHRDIKPENLLVDTSARVVLTDFGIACLVTEQEELKRVVGTVGYAAPEMLAGTATSFEADEFGAGIVLYFMLSKSTPFLAPTTAKTIEKTMEGKVNLRYGCFDHISEHCRTMIYGLICKDVAARIKAHEALRTAYMMSRASMTEPVLDSIPQVQPKKPQGNLPNVMEVSEPSDKLGCATQGHLPFLRKK
eukprot:g10877.t1